MNSSIDKVAVAIQKTIDGSYRKKPKSYETEAEVVRVPESGDFIYVKIPGGVDETPVRKTINAKVGDNVQIKVTRNRAYITGNYSAPPTDDTRAIRADENAYWAGEAAKTAMVSADEAVMSAQQASVYANEAQSSADSAMASAITANIASNSALTQLSVVEDVASVLTWISEHGTYKLSPDTSVVSGKLYFTRSGTAPDYEYTLITEPTGNPHTSNYYELDTLGDESVSNYISSHLALTNAGLWVVKDGNGYKILLANDGLYVYDNQGNLVSTFGENITFSANRGQYIGNQNAYIIFNPANNGSITIGGSNINLGGNKTLDEVLAELSGTFVFDTTYTITGTDPNRIAHFEAHLYQGGNDIKSQYEPEQFTWYLKTEDGEEPIGNPNSGYTKDVNLSDCGYGAEVIAHFTTLEEADALTNDGDNLTDVNNDPISVRASGDSVRVRDLTVSTSLSSIDKLLIVGAEDEHLISMQTLEAYLNANLTKQVLMNTTANWNSQITLVSDANTVYIYTDHTTDSNGNNIAGIKVGDGNAYVVDLPFTDAILTEHTADTSIHITDAERTFWNNKVRCYFTGQETLVFTTL